MRIKLEPNDVLYFRDGYGGHNLLFEEKYASFSAKLNEEQIFKLRDDLTRLCEMIQGDEKQ